MADIVIGYTRDIIPEKVVYTGHETPTTVTIVDNTTQEIGVEVKDHVLGDKITTDHSINVDDLGNHEKKLSVNISNKDDNLLSLDSTGLYAYIDTDEFAKADDLEAVNTSINSIKRTYATKTWVENKNYTTQEDLDTKQDKLTAGDNITIKKNSSGDTVISAKGLENVDYHKNIVGKPKINGVVVDGDLTTKDLKINLDDKADITYVNEEVLSLENEISLKQDVLTAGENIKIERKGYDTIISAIGGSGEAVLPNDIEVVNTVGGIPEGTIYKKGTSLSGIIEQMLTGTFPTTETVVYSGVVNYLPTTPEEIELLNIDNTKTVEDLLSSGFIQKRISPNNQYVVLAIPKSAGIFVDCITVNRFDIAFKEEVIGDYYLYYENNPVTLTNITYKYTFEGE